MRQVRPVEVQWRLFSLEEVNKGDNTVDWQQGRSTPALRVLALVRRKHGQETLDRFYSALARARFEREQTINEPEVIEAALEEAGLDRGLRAEALEDDATREEILKEHEEVVERVKAFGVPTIVLDEGKGPGIFGPVINPVPQGEAAGELWDRVLWLTRQPNFFEVKRGRH